jgi:hypothetical protein
LRDRKTVEREENKKRIRKTERERETKKQREG